MDTKRRILVVIILMVVVFSFSGCVLLQIPVALLGGTFKILGKAIGLAKKLPWWMWI